MPEDFLFRSEAIQVSIYLKRSSFKGVDRKIVLSPFEKGSAIKGNNLLPLGANSFLLE